MPLFLYGRHAEKGTFQGRQASIGKSDPVSLQSEEITMNKKNAFILFSLVLVLLLSACAARTSATPAPDVNAYGGAPSSPGNENAALPTAAPAFQDASKGLTAGGTTDVSAAQDRLVIMNADLTIVIPDPQAKLQAISQMATSMGGFVVSMSMDQTSLQNGQTAPEGAISIRIPSGNLDDALKQIKADAVEVRNENRTGQDVTQQYVDLQSQLDALVAAETQLTTIMQNATKTEDVLAVFNQLESYRQQIDVIKGQMQYFQQASTYSLINVTLIAEQTIQPIEIGGWKPEGVARDAIQSLIKFWQGFVNFLINLVLLVLPILITIFGPIALVIWGIIALVKHNRKKKAQAAKQ
jgi:hypothetical protein